MPGVPSVEALPQALHAGDGAPRPGLQEGGHGSSDSSSSFDKLTDSYPSLLMATHSRPQSILNSCMAVVILQRCPGAGCGCFQATATAAVAS